MSGAGKGARPPRLTVITGGSRGIGHHLVQSFLRDGDVLSISRTTARAEGASEHTLHGLQHDFADVEGIEPTLTSWFTAHPEYEVATLVHNAATLDLGRLDSLTTAELDHAFRVNVFAPLTITSVSQRASWLSPIAARVVYVVSSLGRPIPGLSFAGLGLYSACKAALGRLAMIQQREFELTAPHIKVLRIHPGIVDTDMQAELRSDQRLDPAFAVKTEGLPPYREGDWDHRRPSDDMRTIPASLAAEFIVWAARSPVVSSDEYDFYDTEEFHAARSARPVG